MQLSLSCPFHRVLADPFDQIRRIRIRVWTRLDMCEVNGVGTQLNSFFLSNIAQQTFTELTGSRRTKLEFSASFSPWRCFHVRNLTEGINAINSICIEKSLRGSSQCRQKCPDLPQAGVTSLPCKSVTQISRSAMSNSRPLAAKTLQLTRRSVQIYYQRCDTPKEIDDYGGSDCFVLSLGGFGLSSAALFEDNLQDT